MTETEIMKAIVHLFQACLNIGYHPRHFKEASTVILKKPKKTDYSEPKSYRPITLLDTLGKALEAIISRKLNDMAEEYELLPSQQMGARRKRSVETALETLTEAVHTVWNHGKNGGGKVVSLLSLDVAGAFDNVSHERLLQNLQTKRVPSLDSELSIGQVPPLLRRLRNPLRRWRRVSCHEVGLVLQGRLGGELRGDAAVGEMLGFGFGEEAAGHGHAGDAFQAGEWHFGGLGDGGKGGAGVAGWGREVGVDVEVEEPAET